MLVKYIGHFTVEVPNSGSDISLSVERGGLFDELLDFAHQFRVLLIMLP